ncbi:MAG TPA: hypothetical protein GXZ47_09480 [Treponema sp.]|nr:hypothetical protein [Treponema sp.]
MTSAQWDAFSRFKSNFLKQCDVWLREAGGLDGWLATLQQEAAEADGTPAYPIETPVVFSEALDDIQKEDDLKLIVVGDNPGKNEQLSKNRRYLVGQAGKLGANFFRNHPEIGIDFRKNVVILNKTPLHSAKTKQLGYILRAGGEKAEKLFNTSLRWMAQETAVLQETLACPLWLVGYGELRAKGLFSLYAKELEMYYSHTNQNTSVYLYQHFSMNRFSIDFKKRNNPKKTLKENLEEIGLTHRREILGW